MSNKQALKAQVDYLSSAGRSRVKVGFMSEKNSKRTEKHAVSKLLVSQGESHFFKTIEINSNFEFRRVKIKNGVENEEKPVKNLMKQRTLELPLKSLDLAFWKAVSNEVKAEVIWGHL